MQSHIAAFVAVIVIQIATSSAALSQSGIDTEPPTAPLNLTAIAVSDNQIDLSWQPASDDQQVLSYQITRNDQIIGTPANTYFTDSGLQASSRYTYRVVASDGVNLSRPAVFTLSTLATGGTVIPGAKPSAPDSGVLPGIPPSSASTPPSGVPAGWQLTFSDEFNGNGALDVTSPDRNWRFETMDDGLHRAGNSGIDANGNIIAGSNSVNGKRWSAWYNDFNSANAYRSDNTLVMAGTDSGELDLTRPIDYLDNGTRTSFGASRLYTSWIDTFSRIYVDPVIGHIVDPASPAKSFKYGYIEASVSFAQMITPGFRLSMWLMPASTDAAGQDLVMDKAYDNDGNNGVEIDIFEYEWVNEANANNLLVALIAGDAGREGVNLDAGTLSMDLTQGFHTIALLWQADKIEWYLNGSKFFEVTDPDLIPDVFSYLILSREMNSGVKQHNGGSTDDTDIFEQPPFIPRDPGLFANNVWEFRDRIATDKALVDYIRIWQP